MQFARAHRANHAAAIASAFLLCVAPSIEAVAITFADGAFHILDTANGYPFETVSVADGPGGATTSLAIVAGGAAGGLDLFGSSIGVISGGTVTSQVELTGTSSLAISAGSVNGVRAVGDSRFAITGGEVSYRIECLGCAEAIFLGGDFAGTSGTRFERTDVEISGGRFREVSVVSSTVLIAGGEIRDQFVIEDDPFVSGDGSVVDVWNGAFPGGLDANDESVVRIAGGTFGIAGAFGSNPSAGDRAKVSITGGAYSPDDLLIAFDRSGVLIFGSGFNHPYGNLTSTSGTLTGLLADGTAIEVPFGRASTATITLVPHPSPSCDVEVDQPVYADGDQVVLSTLRFRNPSAVPFATRLRLQLTLPLVGTVDAIDAVVTLPAGLDADLAPVGTAVIHPGLPRGAWSFRCALEEAVNGAVVAEDVAAFEVP